MTNHMEKIAPQTIAAVDQTPIAYFKVEATKPSQSMLFIHCGGGHINPMYLSMASRLKSLNINSYLMDLRGHGQSGGERGHTPNRRLLYDDINQMIELIKNENPTCPISLSGHSIGAGLILNYLSQPNNQQNELEEIHFIAPNFGFYSNTYRKPSQGEGSRKKQEDPFIRSIHWPNIFFHRLTKLTPFV